MKNIDLGQTITILANIGVITGIVFLGFELRQNNQILIAQASYTQFSVERGRRNRLIENVGGITDVMQKSKAGIPLNAGEAFRLNLTWEDLFHSWHWQYREVAAGRLPDDFFDIENARAIWRANQQGLSEYLGERESRLDIDFLQFLKSNIVNDQ
jgi:hypothetical protein